MNSSLIVLLLSRLTKIISSAGTNGVTDGSFSAASDVYKRQEYGGLYGVTLENMTIEEIYHQINDRAEIVKLAFYKDIKDKEPIAPIDEKLLEYYIK